VGLGNLQQWNFQTGFAVYEELGASCQALGGVCWERKIDERLFGGLMKKKNGNKRTEVYFTTGKLSRLLGGIISQPTVSRLFDRGEFGGRVNPLTGRREIEWGSVIEWLKGKGLSEDTNALIEKRRGEEWKRLKRKGKSEGEK
jgi:hypothetical protein